MSLSTYNVVGIHAGRYVCARINVGNGRVLRSCYTVIFTPVVIRMPEISFPVTVGYYILVIKVLNNNTWGP